MAVFWWTGKGYLTVVVVLLVFSAFGLAVPVGGSFLKESPTYWGAAGVVAGAIVWLVGRRVNAKSIASVRSIHFRHKLLYNARHRFMSLPLELWGIPLAIGGITVMAYGMV